MVAAACSDSGEDQAAILTEDRPRQPNRQAVGFEQGGDVRPVTVHNL
ncbi:MAG: hypothetical protein OXI26_11030 [bacterium]|nr:hypothetical protein [bacterium]